MKYRQNRIYELSHFDLEYRQIYKIIAGVDEAGRGAIAGPVCSSAIIIDFNLPLCELIDDSKVLTVKQREQAFEHLAKHCISYAYSFIDNRVIDEINILNATTKSMKEAISKLQPQPNFLLIDGNYYRDNAIPFKTIIDGDAKSLSIASASIIAKVQRDRFMIETADKLYPEYEFATNKGYGTRKHMEAVLKYGPSPIHRLTFLKKLQNRQELSLFNA